MNKIKMLACVLTMGMLFGAFASENVWTLDNSAPMPGKFWTITSPDKKWKLACVPTDQVNVVNGSDGADIAICFSYWTDSGDEVCTCDVFGSSIDCGVVVSGSGVLTMPAKARDAFGNEYSVELPDWTIEGWSKSTAKITKCVIPADYTAYFGCGTSLKCDFEVEKGNPKYYSKDGVLYLKEAYRDDYNSGDVLLQFPANKKGTFVIPDGVTKVRQGAFELCALSELVIGSELEVFESDSEVTKSLTKITINNNPYFKCINGFLLGDYGETVLMTLHGLMKGDVVVPSCVRRVDDYAMSYISGPTSIDFSLVEELELVGLALAEVNVKKIVFPESVIYESGIMGDFCGTVDIYWPTKASCYESGLYSLWVDGTAKLHIQKDAGDWSEFEYWYDNITVVKDMASPVVVSLEIGDDCEGMGSVSGSGVYKEGESVVLKATANKGFAFAGWYDKETGEPVQGSSDYHLANFSYTVGECRQSIVAKFIPISGTVTLKATTEKGQVFAGWYTDSQLQSPYVASDGTDYRTASCTYSIPLYSSLFPRVVSEVEDRNIDLECVPQEFYDSNKQMSLPVRAISYSLPTITAANLPTGLKFDAKTMLVSGTPTKPGEAKIVKFTVKNLTNKTGVIFERLIKIGDARAESLPDLKYNDADGYPAFVPGAEQDMAEVLGQSTMDVLAQGGWTVTGLPAGMKFDPKTGKFSGAPTKGNEAYLVTFKKGNETATITLRTGALPILELEPLVIVDELDESVAIPDMSKFKLTGAGSYIAGKDVTLGATAPAGWVFAGWQEVESSHLGIGMCPDFADMTLDARTNDTRIAAYKFKMPATERMRLRGIFIHQSQDELLSMMAAPGMTMSYTLNSGEDIVQSMNHMVVMAVRNCFMSYQMVSSFPTVTVKGLPAGLKLDAKTLLLSGKVTAKPGHYYATFTAKNLSGYTLTVPVKFIVSDMHQPLSPEDPSDVNTMPPEFFLDEFNKLENLVAGLPIGYEDPYENWGYMIPGTEIAFGHPGCPEGGLLSFSGLPKGMTAKGDTSYTDSVGTFKEWWIEGVPTEAGWYTVSATGKGYDGFEIENYKYSKHIAVAETPSKYVFVKVAQGEGTVTGSGVWNAGKSYSINATPKAGYVFAGWYQDEMCVVPAQNWTFGNECDYRKASQKWTLEAEFLRMMPGPGALYAKFVPKAEDDGDVEVIAIGSYSESGWDSADIYNEYWLNLSDDFIWYINPTEDGYAGDELGLLINSVTEPTVTVKGLPKEFEFEGTYADGLYVIECDGSPAPGEYIAELTVKTATLKNPVTFKFAVRVPHYRHWELPLDYDNGYTLIPGATFDHDMLMPGVNLVGWTVTGLPAGMTFDAKTGRIRGAPTAADKSYTVWFKRGDETASVTMRTGALPVLELEPFVIGHHESGMLDESVEIPDMSKFKLTGGGSYIAGKDVTLGATAPAGWVFAGWEEVDSMHLGIGMSMATPDMLLDSATNDIRVAAYKFKMPVAERMRLRGVFIHQSLDGLIGASAPGYAMDAMLVSGEQMNSDMNGMQVGLVRNLFFMSIYGYSSFPTVTAKGLPTGVTLDAKNLLLTGKVTAKPGYYYATFTAKNLSGYTLTVPVRFIVSNPDEMLSPEDPSDINTMQNYSNEFMQLEMLSVGVPMSYEDPFWGFEKYMPPADGGIGFHRPGDGYGGILSFSGLPKGLKAADDGTYRDALGDSYKLWYIEGVPTEAGWYTVTATGRGFDGLSKADMKYSKHISVCDTPSTYVFVKVGQGEGSVTGTGVWNAGKQYSITATPKTGYVFAGWYQDPDCTMPAENWTSGQWGDFRNPSQKFSLEADFLRMPGNPSIYARFVPKAEDDGEIDLYALGAYYDRGCDEYGYNPFECEINEDFVWDIVSSDNGYAWNEFGFVVDSATLPKVTIKGLPKEFTMEGPFADGLYVIECDGSPAPGEYIAELSITSTTVTKPIVRKFVVRVPHYEHDELPLDYENGYDFTVGVSENLEEIFGDVDFSGWTITGLPAGMTFDSVKGVIKGSPTQADKNYTVWFKRGNEEVATVTMRTHSLPNWVVGTFEGYAYQYADDWDCTTKASIIIDSTGKVLIKGQDECDSWTDSSLLTLIKENDNYYLRGEDAGEEDWGYYEEFHDYEIRKDIVEGIEIGRIEGMYSGYEYDFWNGEADTFGEVELVQNAWKYAQGTNLAPEFSKTATFVVDMSCMRDDWWDESYGGYLMLKFGSNGAVTTAYSERKGGVATATGTAQLVPYDVDGDTVYAWLYAVLSPRGRNTFGVLLFLEIDMSNGIAMSNDIKIDIEECDVDYFFEEDD